MTHRVRTRPDRGPLNTLDFDFQARKEISTRQQLLYGVEGRLSPGHSLQVVSGLVFSPFTWTDYLVSGFLEDDITLIDNKLLLTLGTKLLHTNYTGAETEPSIRLMWTPM